MFSSVNAILSHSRLKASPPLPGFRQMSINSTGFSIALRLSVLSCETARHPPCQHDHHHLPQQHEDCEHCCGGAEGHSEREDWGGEDGQGGGHLADDRGGFNHYDDPMVLILMVVILMMILMVVIKMMILMRVVKMMFLMRAIMNH